MAAHMASIVKEQETSDRGRDLGDLVLTLVSQISLMSFAVSA
jgi:hypothetical protein